MNMKINVFSVMEDEDRPYAHQKIKRPLNYRKYLESVRKANRSGHRIED